LRAQDGFSFFSESVSWLECDSVRYFLPSLATEMQFMTAVGTQVVVPVAIVSTFLFPLVPS
jgi:hypothetical protein